MRGSSPASSESARVFWRWGRALALVAVVVAGCFFAGRALTPKVRDLGPDGLKARMSDGSLELETAVEQINRLDAQDKRQVMQSPEAQAYFQGLKPDQRLHLVRRTLDRTIQQQIERYRKMDPEERAAFIAEVQERQREAREQMRSNPERTREMVNSSDFVSVVENAVKTYLRMSSSEERAELAPLFDGALDNLNYAKGL